jgi:hypothetical protein
VDADSEQPTQKRRGWLRRKQATADEDPSDHAEADTAPKRGGRWLRRKSSEESEVTSDPSLEENPKKERGGWLRRRKRAQADATDDQDDAPERPARAASNAPENDPPIDPEEIDWNALSKSERRRLRKQLKRQNRAA